MSEKKLLRLPLAAAALVACMSAQADYQSPDGNFRISGYGTLAAVRTSTNDAGFNYKGQGGGAGTTPNLDPDSKLAVQGSYKITPTVSVTSQVMTKYDAEAQYIPKVDWLFAKWQATPQLYARVGRIGSPFFMISDFRDVGYTNTFIRPPLDVYSQVPISQFEGGDLTYQWNLGSSNLTASLWYGDSDTTFALKKYDSGYPANAVTGKNVTESIGLTVAKIRGINFMWDFDNGLSLRLGHAQGNMTIDSNASKALIATTSLLAPSFTTATYDTFTADKAKATFTGIGAVYDSGDFVISGEFTRRRTKSYITDTTGYYVVGGYRIAKFTPYVGFSKLKTDRRSPNPFAVLSTSNPLRQSAEDILSTQKVDNRTTTLGVRWDVASGLALKAQWDRMSKPADSAGVAFDPTPAFINEKRRVDAMTLAVDFVF